MKKLFVLFGLAIAIFYNINLSYAVDGYTELEFLQSSGAQYIVTDYIGNLHSRYEGAVYIPSTKDDYYYIASRMDTGNTRNIAFAGYANGVDGFYIGYGTYSGPNYRFGISTNKKVYFMTDYHNMSKSVTVDGNTSTKTIDPSEVTTSFTNTAPLQIFFNRIHGASSSVSYAAPSGTRIYYLKIYDRDVLVHDYIPVRRNSDGVLGVYDNVTRTFLTNAGSGTFIAGERINMSYSCGSGSGNAPTDSTIYTTGDTVTILPNTCNAPSGSLFDKWDCDGTNINAGSTFTITSNTTCTAQYNLNCSSNGSLNSEYTQLEYFTITGTQYIDTKIIPTNWDWYAEFGMSFAATGKIFFGAGYECWYGDYWGYQLGIAGTNGFAWWGKNNSNYAGADAVASTLGVTTNTFYDWKISKSGIYVNGVLKSSMTGTSNYTSNTRSLWIGKTNNESTRGYNDGTSSWEYVKIYNDNNSLVFNGIPVKQNNTNIIGMCDLVSGAFLTNSGSGTFVAGPILGANTIILTWDGVATTPASCSYGSTFVPPTPAPRPGYRFTGWKVKTVNP